MPVHPSTPFARIRRRPQLALLLAASCAVASPTWAGRELPPGKTLAEMLPLENAPVIAAVTTPAAPVVPDPITPKPTATEPPAPASTGAASTAAAQVAPPPAPKPEPDLMAAAGDPPIKLNRPAPSQNVTINLINSLVKRGVLPQEDADALIKQAEADAAVAREQAESTQVTATQAAMLAQAAAQAAAQATPDPVAEGTVRVTYIPEIVKAQMRDQIKAELMEQAKNEKWVSTAPNPEWVSRFRVAGDVRVRYQADVFPDGNDNTGSFPNFNAINTGQPFDVSGTTFSPQLNVDQNRNRIRLRARMGAQIDMGEGFTGGMRIATGDSNSPVSTNQSLGGSGGNFSKYAIWLDRGFLKYEAGGLPTKNLAVTVGRFDNPFFAASDIVWDDDLGFDGFAVQARYEVFKGVTPFLAAGAFPVYNTDFNFSSNRPDKFPSEDKWLYGAQGGVTWTPHKDFTFKSGVAYYDFENIEGQLSDPFVPLTTSDAGNTDGTRPSFAQKGNTYRPLRNIIPTADNNFGTSLQYQYFGLASSFRNLVINGKLDYNGYEPFQISVFGEYVRNLAHDPSAINAFAVNNRGPNGIDGTIGRYEGGDTAWYLGLRVGRAALEKRGDWSLGLNYRYVESDAVVDGFNDSDFGGGGTNLKGYTISGSLALSQRVALGLRWMSANEIVGPQFKQDVFQIDVNGKF